MSKDLQIDHGIPLHRNFGVIPNVLPKTQLGYTLLKKREEAISDGLILLNIDEVNKIVEGLRGEEV